MPLYDYECPYCGHHFEEMAAVKEESVRCENCDGMAKRSYTANWNHRSDASWVADCTVPFDKDDRRPEVRAYLADPSDRQKLKRAMKVAGIRHLEDGEVGRRRQEGVPPAVMRELMERHNYRMGRI